MTTARTQRSTAIKLRGRDRDANIGWNYLEKLDFGVDYSCRGICCFILHNTSGIVGRDKNSATGPGNIGEGNICRWMLLVHGASVR